MGIIDRYHELIYNMYMNAHPQANPDKVKSLIIQCTNQYLLDIPCLLHNNIKHEYVETSMLKVFDWIEQYQPIISGNGTFFKQHAEYLGPSTKMLEVLMDKRDHHKAVMYTFPKGSVGYKNKYIAQISTKVIMNADYGGSGTPMSAFYSIYIPPATTGTAKNITTTLICCLEFICGNNDSWAKLSSLNELFDMILNVLNDNEDRVLINDNYSVDEVYEWLFSRTNNLSIDDCKFLHNYLETLSPHELTKLMLAYNPRLILQKYLYVEVGETASYFKSHQLDIEKISQITDVDIAKNEVYKAGYGSEPPEEIGSYINTICNTIRDNCIYSFIPNDVETRATYMKRILVCVTDTDSLMVQFASFIDDFQTKVSNYKDSCILAGGLGLRLFIDTIIPKLVKYIALNFNVKDEYYRKKLKFKNEYFYAAMLLFAKKMYAASMLVQEGNPRNPHKLDIKGLSFTKRDSAEFLEPIMVELYDKYVLTSDTIRIDKMLDICIELRNKLQTEMKYDSKYYKVLSIKDISAYGNKEKEDTKPSRKVTIPAQLRGSIVWNNIMPEEEILPMDRVIVIPLSFKLLHEKAYTDQRIEKMLSILRIDNENEKLDPYISIPEFYKTIPEWIQPVIDIDYAVDKTLSPLKQMLSAFRVNQPETRGGSMPSRMIMI